MFWFLRSMSRVTPPSQPTRPVRRRAARGPGPAFRPHLESLEDKTLLNFSPLLPGASGAAFGMPASPDSLEEGISAPVLDSALQATGDAGTGHPGTIYLSGPGPSQSADQASFEARGPGRHAFHGTFGMSVGDAFTGGDKTGTTDESGTGESAAAATHFAVMPLDCYRPGTSAGTETGSSTPMLVEALDASNRPVQNYTGTVQFSSSDADAQLPDAYTFQVSDRGAHVFDVMFGTTGEQSVTATDEADGSVSGTASVTVAPATVATHFAVLTPQDAAAGGTTQVQVVALDESNRPVRNYTGTVGLSSSDTAAQLPGAYTFQASDRGRHTFDVTLNTTGEKSITATDQADTSVSGTASVTAETAAEATHFALVTPRHEPQTGVATRVLVVALDASNRPVTDYTGTVHFSSSDAAAQLPDDYTFPTADRGAHLFEVTFGTAGDQSLTATDQADGSVSGTASVTVAPSAAATHFAVLTLPGSRSDGTTSVLVVALDASNRPVRNYTGTVHFTSTNADAELPEDYTFQSEDRGSHVFEVPTAATDGQTLTVTDTADGSLTGSTAADNEPGPGHGPLLMHLDQIFSSLPFHRRPDDGGRT